MAAPLAVEFRVMDAKTNIYSVFTQIFTDSNHSTGPLKCLGQFLSGCSTNFFSLFFWLVAQ